MNHRRTQFFSRAVSVFALAAAMLFLSQSAKAATKTWDGGGANGNWNTAANWVGDIAPVAGDDLVFPDGVTQFTTSNNFFLFTSFHSLSVTGGSYTFGGNPFTLTTALTVNSGTQAINTFLTLGGPVTITCDVGATITILSVSNGGNLLTIDGAGNTILGTMSGSGGLTKNGTGGAGLATSSSYSGPTTVANGFFIVDGTATATVINVTGGGLGGTGTVGRVTATAGGIGAGTLTSPTGILSVQGNVTMSSGSIVAIKEQGNTTGTGYDQINVTGVVDLGGCDLLPIPLSGFVPAIGDVYRIINNDGTDAVIGTFNNLPEGATLSTPGGINIRVTYHGGTGNDVEIKRIAKVSFDFDGDGRSDVSVFRPSEGNWYLLQTTAGFAARQFGANGDITVAADYDGDGKADIAVFRPANGYWYQLSSSTGAFTAQQFGANGDRPVPADFDGDGKADLAVYRPAGGGWYVLRSSDNTVTGQAFGIDTDRPVPGDYDGDGKADIAVFRGGGWHVLQSSNGAYVPSQFGIGTDTPTPGDFDGDGKTDTAVFRAGAWYFINSATNTFSGVSFGTTGDTPSPADYDGDGKLDIAVYRIGAWYILNSSNGAFVSYAFGNSTDLPIPRK
ncbi:MAG: VCBS repeat-containing protein [Pyrinomonadaceae bacterium]